MAYTKDCDARRAKDMATKTLVAIFPGSGFVAEREGDEVRVYVISGEEGAITKARVVGINDAAKGGMTAAKLQHRIEERRRATR